MTEATIVIPTHDHAAFLPVAVRSALAQRGVDLELFVVGDGVGDDTRRALEPFTNDARVRFFDLPKGERRGERNRHLALGEARGEIVCYLSDDDILLPWHAAEMRRLLQSADFAHSAPVLVDPGRELVYRPADLARPEFLSLIRNGLNNFISLTGAAHTRELYDRLPHGWRPAPPGTPTDIHMWRQVVSVPGFHGVTSTRLTAIHFPDPAWRAVDDRERASTLEAWLERAGRPGAEDDFQALLDEATERSAQEFKLRSIELSAALEAAEGEIAALRMSWWKRAARRVARTRPVRQRLR